MMTNSQESGVSTIGIVAIVLILSLLGIVAVSFLGSVSSMGVDYMFSQQAFYIAEAGKEWYIGQLQNDTDWNDNASSGDKGPKDFAGGNFSISVSNCQTNSIDMIATAALTGYENQPIRRVVSCHIQRSPIDAFNYALYVGGDIHSQNTENFIVTGQQLEGAENLPTVNFMYYSTNANHLISGDHTFNSGTYDGIWYIDGNVTVNSNVTINGTIIATGNVDMKNQANIIINPVSPYPALVANGSFQFQNATNLTINGVVYVGADFEGNFLVQQAANITITGTVIVAGNFNLQNSADITITYNPAIAQNPPPGFSDDTTGSVIISDWKEILN